MTPPDGIEEEVGNAASALVAAFGAHDVEAYFGSFSPQASFVLHAEPEVFEDLAAYRAAWRAWEADGFRVEGCRSVGGRARALGSDTAVWVHSVETRLAGVDATQHERETIVFERIDGRWLAVHEHLSPAPAGAHP